MNLYHILSNMHIYDFLFYFSGEEIDFLRLLKSFGFDMHQVATAIGVDIDTLQNMESEKLLELLSSKNSNN